MVNLMVKVAQVPCTAIKMAIQTLDQECLTVECQTKGTHNITRAYQTEFLIITVVTLGRVQALIYSTIGIFRAYISDKTRNSC
jgi:hypothetical protein